MAKNNAAFFETRRTRVERYRTPGQRRALADDPAVRLFSHWPDRSDEAFAASIAAMRDRDPFDGQGWINLAILSTTDGDYVGDHALLVEPDVATLGIALLPAMRGRGLAGEVITASLAMLRRHGLTRFRAEIHPANTASLAAFERVGFQRLEFDADATGPFWLLERG